MIEETPEWFWWFQMYGLELGIFIIGIAIGNIWGFSRGLMKGLKLGNGNAHKEH